MNRRGFLKLFGAGVAGIALEQAIPLGRVWSFPKEIKIADPPALAGNTFLTIEYITAETLRMLQANMRIEEFTIQHDRYFEKFREFSIGSIVKIRFPQRFSIPADRQPLHLSPS